MRDMANAINANKNPLCFMFMLSCLFVCSWEVLRVLMPHLIGGAHSDF
jgi:hypothetical protein